MKIIKLSDEDYETLKKVLTTADHDRRRFALEAMTSNYTLTPSFYEAIQNVQRMNALFQEVEYENVKV